MITVIGKGSHSFNVLLVNYNYAVESIDHRGIGLRWFLTTVCFSDWLPVNLLADGWLQLWGLGSLMHLWTFLDIHEYLGRVLTSVNLALAVSCPASPSALMRTFLCYTSHTVHLFSGEGEESKLPIINHYASVHMETLINPCTFSPYCKSTFALVPSSIG